MVQFCSRTFRVTYFLHSLFFLWHNYESNLKLGFGMVRKLILFTLLVHIMAVEMWQISTNSAIISTADYFNCHNLIRHFFATLNLNINVHHIVSKYQFKFFFY